MLVVCLCSLAALAACAGFLLVGYEPLLQWILTTTQKPYLEDTLRKSVLTPAKFRTLRMVAAILLFIIPAAATLLLMYSRQLVRIIRFVRKSMAGGFGSVRNVFAQNSRSQNIAVLTVLCMVTTRSLYYLIFYPLQYDEMWSYNYFTAQPFYYPFVVSSNYPLYEVCTGLFKWLPFGMKVNIRLPGLIAGIASCVLLYACLRAYLHHHYAALAGMVLFACMPVSTFYMLYARGVMFSLLFAILALFCLLFWICQPHRYSYLVLYVLAAAAGMYAMPTQIYLLVVLFIISLVICLRHFPSHSRYLVYAHLAAATGSLLLYAPLMAGSGISLLLSSAVNQTGNTLSWSDIFQYNAGVSFFFTGYGTGLLILVLLLLVTIVFYRQQESRLLGWFCGCLLLLPLLISAMQNVTIPPRALAFTGLIVPLSFAVFIATFKTIRKSYLIMSIIAVAGTGSAVISHHHPFLNWSLQQDKRAEEIFNLFVQHHVTTCYDHSAGSNFFYYHPALEYYYRLEDRTFVLFTNAANSLRYKPLSKSDHYDCIVYHLHDTVDTIHYREWYRNEEEDFKILIREWQR